MSFYDFFMAPWEKGALGRIRKDLICHAKGLVLEIGIGSGANLKYYDFNKVTKLIGTDIKIPPVLATKKLDAVDFITCSAEELPFEDSSFDVVISTLVLCSVSNVELALAEIKRVIKPNGKYLFIEHIRPYNKLGSIFDVLNTVWKRNSFDCQLNKQTDILIEKAGLRMIWEKRRGAGIVYYGIAEI